MKLIERYILRRASLMFVATLVPLLGIVWVTQALGSINLVTDSGQSIFAFLKLASLVLPSVIPIILPFALVIGVSQTLTVMNSDSELTVLNSAGASRMTIIRPVMILAVAMSFVSFAVDNFVEPYSRTAVRKMIATAHADMLSAVVQENTFRKITDGLYVQVAERRNGGVLSGLFVADTRDPRFELVYYAREGAVDENSSALVMKDGEVHRKLPDGNVSIIKFDSYAFDLADLTQSVGKSNIRAKDRDLIYLFDPDPNDPQYKKNPGAFTAEIHRRFTEWLFPAVFGLIALVVSGDARSHREARVHPMITALLTALFVRWTSFYASNNADDSAFYIPIMYLIPAITAALAIRYLGRNKSLDIPVTLGERLTDLRDRLMTRFSRAGSTPAGGSGTP
ncbi:MULTISPECIES: LPS export ABC transporter permease LptF [unclassified Shinella]|jgi:lipopolysaccharide export system permease protein|uniref:LPS export ABC transporter permease LptF n=1 Tax=unclassified Shinella TaxID=2643062 RepID=UPI0003C52F95|nr:MULTISPECIES: LPS export ABC transporter permease LptF [unclassified Shinella]EYR78805.1 putative transmembrane protein [Shinella sp. DD12]MCO5150585.1 LPS export ABC transporter permease LptF [Shinella sp.]MDC7261532.1 LPS export ABC transporter permease LptF [Shinella sp. HY16]MDC7268427.1 LPS export ABC transporter permease LptF [Shinella sp. YZ44]MDG4671514.1 LPS export ABC transporter permease LptF [Shinella sp. 838]